MVTYSSAKDDTVQSLRDDARNTANEVGDDLRATAARAGRKVRSFVDNASEELSHAGETVSTHIHEKPLQSTFIALGIGFVLGALLRR